MGFLAEWWIKARRVADFLRPMQIPLHSAYTGFFLILSLFPGFLLLLGLLRYTSITVQDFSSVLEGWLPESLLPTVHSLIEASYRHSSGTVVTVSVLGTLISSSRGMYGVRGGLNAIDPPQEKRGYLRRRSISVLYNLSFLLMLVLTLFLYLAGAAMLDYLQMSTIPALMALTGLVDLRMVLLLVLQTGVFTLMYALLPDRRQPISQSWPGALLAALGWQIFSRLFSLYVAHFVRYTNIYGSIYAVALGMLWLYFCISIFFYGKVLNRILRQRRQYQ